MGIPYKMQRKKNPQKRTEPGKWYAVPKTGTPVEDKVMSRMATADTTVADFELEGSAKLISKWLYTQFMNGKRARVPGLGTFRITFGSEGVDDIRDFHTGLIRNVKIAFIEEGIKHADEFFEILHLVQEEVIIAAVFCFLVDVGQEFSATDQAVLLVSLPRFLFFTELVKEKNVFLAIKGETDDVLRIYSSL